MTPNPLCPNFDLTGAFPCGSHDDAANAPTFTSFTLAEKQFLYIGQALTRQEFAAYVESYDFGSIPPSYIVFHHTAIPSTKAARWPSSLSERNSLQVDQAVLHWHVCVESSKPLITTRHWT